MNAREMRIAEETVSAIDHMSRLLGGIEDGNWHYAGDKIPNLIDALSTLRVNLARTDQVATGPSVAAAVRRESRHYRIGKALYMSTLEQVEEAKKRRDFLGEIDAVRTGYAALESAPWYPAQAGDILHVAYEATTGMSATGETYVVEHSEQEGGFVLRALSAEPDLISPGALAPGIVDSPLMEAWFEVGPHNLTIVRHGRVIHGPGGGR